MMWNELEKPWQAAFTEAWEAYRMGSIPIGAALADECGEVIASGRSMQFEHEAPAGQVAWSKLSHAELNTLLKVSAHDHPNIRGCTLYATVEPCPLCMGAIVMANVRALRFAARDAWAGSTGLVHLSPYIASKHIAITGPIEELEVISTAMNTEYFLKNSGMHNRTVIDAWRRDCPEGVRLGMGWRENGWLEACANEGKEFGEVFKEMDLSRNATGGVPYR